MVICLITPPSIFLLDERVFLSLGILKVAAVLEKAGHTVEMLDLSGVSNYETVVLNHAKSSKAQIFGLTATTPQLPAATKILNSIRKGSTARVMLGGPHITLVNAAKKKEERLGIEGRAVKSFRQLAEMYDVLIAGDGEDAIFAALTDDPPKLIDADDPKSDFFLNNARLNETPYPARHLIDVPSYHYSIDGLPALSLIAQLGCPFQCNFCSGRNSPMLRRIRMRTTENILEEIRTVYETYGTRGFMLYDDELNVNPKMIELMRGIENLQKELGTEFRLRGFVKSELFNKEQAEAMKAAGFRWILTGFESGSERILENINKKATRTENTRCVQIARDSGLKVKALMSIGHAGETEQTIKDTRNWLLEVKPDDFDVTIITTYPGSPYYDDSVSAGPGLWKFTCSKSGDTLYSQELDYTQVADYYKGVPNGGYRSYVYTDSLSAEDLVNLRDKTENEVREILKIPFNQSAASRQFEHSMGQGLPEWILKCSTKNTGQLKSLSA